jgi:hypothetical protein
MLPWMLLAASASAETEETAKTENAADSVQCSTPIPGALFDSKLRDIETALSSKDLKQMELKIQQTADSIPCLAQPITQIQASQYHLLQGIYQFVQKNQDLSQTYFASARAANPTNSISNEFFPEGHILHQMYNEAPAIEDSETVELPGEGNLHFDGLAKDARPLYRPTIFQHVSGSKALTTAVLEPGDPMPSYSTQAAVAEAPPTELKIPDAVPEKQGLSTIQLGMAGAGAVSLGAGAFLLAKGYTITSTWTDADDQQRSEMVEGWDNMDSIALADALETEANQSYIFPGWGAAALGSGLIAFTFTR